MIDALKIVEDTGPELSIYYYFAFDNFFGRPTAFSKAFASLAFLTKKGCFS